MNTIAIDCDRADAEQIAALIHNCIMASGQFARGVGGAVIDGHGDEIKRQLIDLATEHVLSIFRRIDPQDPMEEMLLTQAIVTHARMLWLNRLAMEQSDIAELRSINEAADRAANTYRRQMLALREYRRPFKSFVAVRQTNLANQQVVQNGIQDCENATNEQGFDGSDRTGDQNGGRAAADAEVEAEVAETPPSLPVDSGGPGTLEGICGKGAAMDPEHRAEDSGGESKVEHERPEARRTQRSTGR